MNKNILIFLKVAIVLLFAGCHASSIQQVPTIGVDWMLATVNGKDVKNSGEREAYIRFDEKKRLQGFGGCNLLMGSYEFANEGKLGFSKIASTMMACPYLEEERKFFDALEATSRYTVNNDILTLFNKCGEAVATLKATTK